VTGLRLTCGSADHALSRSRTDLPLMSQIPPCREDLLVGEENGSPQGGEEQLNPSIERARQYDGTAGNAISNEQAPRDL
jgi:hypothetical protein